MTNVRSPNCLNQNEKHQFFLQFYHPVNRDRIPVLHYTLQSTFTWILFIFTTINVSFFLITAKKSYLDCTLHNCYTLPMVCIKFCDQDSSTVLSEALETKVNVHCTA